MWRRKCEGATTKVHSCEANKRYRSIASLPLQLRTFASSLFAVISSHFNSFVLAPSNFSLCNFALSHLCPIGESENVELSGFIVIQRNTIINSAVVWECIHMVFLCYKFIESCRTSIVFNIAIHTDEISHFGFLVWKNNIASKQKTRRPPVQVMDNHDLLFSQLLPHE